MSLIAIGQLLGQYRILAELGKGGMGEVYRAHDTKLGRDVALKVLPPAFAGDSERIARFNREARAVAALNHPHIVTIYSVEDTHGVHFLTMELVEGKTLDRSLVTGGLPVEQLVAVAWALSDALATAHARGIVHRDLKPANVMITHDNRVKVLDFGLAKILAEPAPRPYDPTVMAIGETGAGLVMGTVPYMSPEQVEGKSVDQRSDLFSLGVIIHEMATGERPFRGGSAAMILSAILRDPAPDVRAHRVDLPAALSGLLARCLEKDRDRRIKSAGEVRDELDRIRRALAATASADVTIAPSSRAANPGGEADRLADEGARLVAFAMSGSSAARMNLEQAEVYLTRALALVPTHIKALCQFATWHYVMSNRGFQPVDVATTSARRYIFAALAVDDQNIETHAGLGRLFLFVDDDFQSARRHIDRAIALGPREPDVIRLHSILLKLEGRFDEAIAAAQRLISIAPDYPAHWNTLGDVLLCAGRHEEALAALREALSRQAGFTAALERMEQTLVRLGRIDESNDFRIARLHAAHHTDRADLLFDESKEVGPVEARRRDLLREVDSLLSEAEASDPFAASWLRTTADRLIVAYSELGDWANAMAWIERWYAKRPGRIRRLLMDLPLDRKGLATHPRYARLLRVAGLEHLG